MSEIGASALGSRSSDFDFKYFEVVKWEQHGRKEDLLHFRKSIENMLFPVYSEQ